MMTTEVDERARRLRNAEERVAAVCTSPPEAHAAFGCSNPKAVVPGVAAGWQTTDREATRVREQRATTMLQRILGDRPEGHPCSGLTIDTAAELHRSTI